MESHTAAVPVFLYFSLSGNTWSFYVSFIMGFLVKNPLKMTWVWQGNDNPKKLKQSNKSMAQGGNIQFLHPLQPWNLRKERFPRPYVTKIWPTSRDNRTSAKILTKMPKSHMEKEWPCGLDYKVCPKSPNYNVFFSIHKQVTNSTCRWCQYRECVLITWWQKHKEYISSFSASQNTSWHV